MKLSFRWVTVLDQMTPICESDSINSNGVSPLACLLMDDGGMGYVHAMPWLDDGLKMARLVQDGVSDRARWDRECWGAELAGNMVKISSLYEDDCFEIVGLNSFNEVLKAWREFVASPKNEAQQTLVAK